MTSARAPLLEKAISKDPRFARAYASLALLWGSLASLGYEEFGVVSTKSEPAARKALELAPESAEAHAAMGNVHSWLDSFTPAAAEAEEAIRLNPNLSNAYMTMGMSYGAVGDLDRSLMAFQKAYELDPLHFRAGQMVALVARVANKKTLSLEVLEKLRNLDPENPLVYAGFAELYMLERKFEEAQKMLDLARKISEKEPLVELNQGILFALTGRGKDAETVLQQLNSRNNESVRLYGKLFINTALGKLEPAFEALGRMSETHSWPMLIKTLPIFVDLRKDQRFADFCAKMGLQA